MKYITFHDKERKGKKFINYRSEQTNGYHFKFDIETYLRNTGLFYDDTIGKLFTDKDLVKGIVVLEGIVENKKLMEKRRLKQVVFHI